MGPVEEKLALRVDELKDLGGPGRTVAYAEIKAGRLKARKCGNRTFILIDDFRDFMNSLPISKGQQ